MERYIENRKVAYAPRPKRRGQPAWNKGKKCPYMTERNKRLNPINLKGDKNPRWRGGVSTEAQKIRSSPEGREWRRKVLARDDHKCIWCESTEKLHVDHIKPFALYPDLRMDINNGRTLCYNCHIKSAHFCRECGTKI